MRSHVSRNPWQAKRHTVCYDATNGLNANNGNAATPRQTIADANALTLRGGDNVLFKRGEAWTGAKLTVAVSGVPQRPILFGAYGSGALPIIARNSSGDDCITATSQHDLVFDSIDANAASSRDGFGFLDMQRVLVRNCIGRGSATTYGIHFEDDNGTTRDIIVSGCTASSNHGSGIVIQNQLAISTVVGVTVNGCISHDNGTSTSADHGIYLRNVVNGHVYDNTSYYNKDSGIKLNTTDACIVERNLIYGDNDAKGSEGIIRTATGAHPGGNVFKNNIIHNLVLYGIDLGNAVTGDSFLHNTIVNCGKNTVTTAAGYGMLLGTTISGFTFKNNIFYQDATFLAKTNSYTMRIGDLGAIDNNSWDNNEYYYPGGVAIIFYNVGSATETLAQWQALGTNHPDAHSLNSDPVFVTNWSDLHLQTTSPCKNAGATGLGVVNDYDGNVRPYGATAPDVGAYEFQGA